MPDWVLMTTAVDADGARDALMLCDAMIGAVIAASEAGNDLNNAYQRILENEYPEGYPLEQYAPYNGVFQQYMFAYYRGREKKKGK